MPNSRGKLPSHEKSLNLNPIEGFFDNHPNSKFAIKILGPEYIEDYQKDSVEEAYLKLRAKIYIEENGFLGESSRRPDGTEIDIDDERATHIIALRNNLGKAAVVGCIRLPQKTDYNDRPLPVEEFFPEYFTSPAPINSIEVSRLIVDESNYEDRKSLKKSLMVYALAYTIKHNLGPVYAVVEDYLVRDLNSLQVPIEVITEPKWIEKYNSVNYAIKVDQYEFEQRIGKEALKRLNTQITATEFFGSLKQ